MMVSPQFDTRGSCTGWPRALPLTLALAITLSGCASWSPQNPENQQGVNATSVAPAPALASWWQHFNDPLLSSLVTQALQANTSIRSAQAALQQARALRDVKTAGLLPSVNASTSARNAASRAVPMPATAFGSGSMPAGNPMPWR